MGWDGMGWDGMGLDVMGYIRTFKDIFDISGYFGFGGI